MENNKIIDNNKENDELIDETTIQYKIDDIDYLKNIRIFGDKFVENNKDKCKIIINGNEFELTTHKDIYKYQLNKNIFEIKLIGIQQITDMSYMFSDCELLSLLPDISKWNTSNATNMSYIFSDCKSLSSLPDISKWNTSNVNNMSYMFSDCISLSSLPEISKWNTSNVTNISDIFSNCSRYFKMEYFKCY